MSCNGWSNHATWLVNAWTDGDGEILRIICPSNGDATTRAQNLKDYVSEWYIDRFIQSSASLALDLLQSVLSGVDWYELVGHYESCELDEDTNE